MNNDILLLAILVAAVLIGSALCSGAEAALLTVNPLRVHDLAANVTPVKGAKKLAKIRQRLGRTLTALTIANNIFNIFGSLMLGIYATFVFQGGLDRALFSIGLTILVLLFGEILPKSLGAKLPLKISLLTNVGLLKMFFS